MKINVEKLQKINTVFMFVFFIGALLFVCGSGALIVRDVLKDLRYARKRGVENVTSEEKIPTYSTDFIDTIEDVYVFAKSGNLISAAQESEKSGLSKAAKDSAAEKNKVLNLIFVSARTKESRTLLENDAMIVLYVLARKNTEPFFAVSKNVYVIAASDTDADKKLSIQDDTALYVSDYDGSGLQKIADNVFSVKFIADNLLLFCEYKNGRRIFKTYNTLSGQAETVLSIESEMAEKRFGNIKFH